MNKCMSRDRETECAGNRAIALGRIVIRHYLHSRLRGNSLEKYCFASGGLIARNPTTIDRPVSRGRFFFSLDSFVIRTLLLSFKQKKKGKKHEISETLHVRKSKLYIMNSQKDKKKTDSRGRVSEMSQRYSFPDCSTARDILKKVYNLWESRSSRSADNLSRKTKRLDQDRRNLVKSALHRYTRG